MALAGCSTTQAYIAQESIFVYTKIMQIVWDEPKSQANIDKHGLDFAQLTPEFFLESFVKDTKTRTISSHRETGRRYGFGDFRSAWLRRHFHRLDEAGQRQGKERLPCSGKIRPRCE
jgi:hypothetical protein